MKSIPIWELLELNVHKQSFSLSQVYLFVELWFDVSKVLFVKLGLELFAVFFAMVMMRNFIIIIAFASLLVLRLILLKI
jgi:hypothetical protein